MQVVILLLQADDGPIKMIQSSEKGISRTIARVQLGNPDLFAVRAVLDGDERHERTLRDAWAELHIARDWYDASVQLLIPDDIAHCADWDEAHEKRRMAATRMGDIPTREAR
jgi:hypothetical protein